MIGLVLLIPKHTIHLKFFNFSPEKLTSELGNLKWKIGDFVDFSPEFTTLKNSVMSMKT